MQAILRFSVAALTISAASAVVARRAHACSGSPCVPAWAVPGAGASVPANVPAITWSNGRSSAWTPDGSRPSATLETTSGTPVDADVELQGTGGLVRPKQPLVDGTTYVLKFETWTCDADPTPRSESFVAAAPTPLPTSLGVVTPGAPARRSLEVSTSSGSCTSTIDAAVVDLAIAPSQDVEPWRGLVRYTTKVDGEVWARSPRPGMIGRDPGWPQAKGSRQVHQLFAKCSGEPGADEGLSEGKHRVEIAVAVAGASESPPPIVLDVELRCDAAEGAGASCTLAGPGRAGPIGLAVGAAAFAAAVVRRRARRMHRSRSCLAWRSPSS